jgi:cytochrome c556
MRRSAMILAATVGSVMFAGAMLAAAATPAQIIAERRAGYKHMGENFKAMKDAIDAGAPVVPLASKAAEIVDWARRIPTMFPPGTETGGGTHAKPAIWSNRADFDKRAEALEDAARKLEQAAQSGDKEAFAAQWKATAKVCGGCHETYRYKLS